MSEDQHVPIPLDPANLDNDTLLRLLWTLDQSLVSVRPYFHLGDISENEYDVKVAESLTNLEPQVAALLVAAWRRDLITVPEPPPWKEQA